MNTILWIILFALLLLVGKKRGAKTFFTFLLSMLLIVIYIILMSFGINAILLAFILCVVESLLSLFYLNGYHSKTKASFISVMIVQLIVFVLTYIISYRSNIGAYGLESLETVGAFDFGINYNMINVIVGMYLVSIIGTVIDTSISVSSAMNEVYENNPKITEKELYKSGMNVGGDILSTTIKTLYFALVSTFIGFFMWHRGIMIEEIFNYKVFAKYLIQLLIAFIGSILIIPVTAFISSRMILDKPIIMKKKKTNK